MVPMLRRSRAAGGAVACSARRGRCYHHGKINRPGSPVGRSLPPLNPLRSFEAAARHLSYTLAAEELNVTQVAVSRQVRVLEQYLEVALFERGARTLRLTDAGRALLSELSRALDHIETAAANVSRRGRRNVLAVQVYTAFAQRWLIPRLVAFRARHPRVEIELRVSDQPLNFERQNLAAAIISATEPPAAFACRLLAGRELFPVCAPSLVAGRSLPLDPTALRGMPMLHSLARPEAWPEWLRGAGLASLKAADGLRFETSSMTLQAARDGVGVAIGIGMLVEPELQSGALVAPFRHRQVSARNYYLVTPKDLPPSRALADFTTWLMEEAAPHRAA
jgi:LysR family glycine cleavage system transcriptional activator